MKPLQLPFFENKLRNVSKLEKKKKRLKKIKWDLTTTFSYDEDLAWSLTQMTHF